MPPPNPKAANRESDEQSIKARKSQIFEPQAAPTADGTTRPFAAYLKHTPPAPLPAGTKAALAGLGALIALLLLAGLLTG